MTLRASIFEEELLLFLIKLVNAVDEVDDNQRETRMTQRIYEFPDGLKYEGQINLDGLPHGTGKIFYPDGTKYEGEWKNN